MCDQPALIGNVTLVIKRGCKKVSVNCAAGARESSVEKLGGGGPYWFPVGVSANTSNMRNQSTRQNDSELLNTVLQLLTEEGHAACRRHPPARQRSHTPGARAKVLQAQPL